MNEYVFSFEEINGGSVKIKADSEPDRGDVIDAIQSGNAFYNNTEYGEIKLVETTSV